jgi:elongation factor G
MEKQWPLISDGPFKVDDFAPAVEIYIEPESDGDPARLAAALSALAADRPNFQFAFDQTVGATILSGIDELQLRELIDALKELHRVKIVGNPQAAYRERITEQTEVDYTHKKQTAGVGEFARVKLVLEPTPTDYGCTFAALGASTKLRDDFIAAVERGVRSSTFEGVVGGFPVIGMRVMLVDGEAHGSDSTPMAFEAAASAAIKEGLRQGRPQLLEPVLRVEIATPEIYVGAVIADLKLRNGATDGRGRRCSTGIAISALVGATSLFGYADTLATITDERGTFSVQFDRYASILPPDDPSFRPAVALSA